MHPIYLTWIGGFMSSLLKCCTSNSQVFKNRTFELSWKSNLTYPMKEGHKNQKLTLLPGLAEAKVSPISLSSSFTLFIWSFEVSSNELDKFGLRLSSGLVLRGGLEDRVPAFC